MMYRHLSFISVLVPLCLLLTAGAPESDLNSGKAMPEPAAEAASEVDIPEIIFSHIGDSYEWHIAKFGNRDIAIPLPIILYSKNSGINIFSSKKIGHGAEYKGFHIAPAGSPYEGKIVENVDGTEQRPVDISITKNVIALMASSLLLMVIVLLSARWYRKHDALKEPPKGVAAVMEPVIMMIHDIAKDNIGEDYKRYSPYLIMAFLFIFINNILGIIPIFPFGANLTGNIAVTMTLALITFLTVNLTGTRHYFKEIFAPDVPVFLKPIMPIVEVFSVVMKPLSLTIRLFANMLAGHIQILSIVCIIFIISKYGAVISGTMSAVSVAFGIFLNFLEILVAFIQAYVFTILSAVYIGLARQKH